MPALDHASARGRGPFIAARNDRDAYSQMMLFRGRSPSPSRGVDELLLRGLAAKKGKSGAIAVSVAGIKHTLERRSLDHKLSILGSQHPEVIDIMVKLSRDWYFQGLYREVEDLQVKIVDFRRQKLGPTHSETLWAMDSVGTTRREGGRCNDSVPILSQVYDTRRDALGAKHIDTLATLLNLTVSWQALGRHIDAVRACREIIEVREIALGPTHPETINAISFLAQSLSNLGRIDEAEAAQLQVLEARRKADPQGRDIIWCMADLARTWSKQGRYEEAEEMDRQVLELRRKTQVPTHPFTLLAMQDLANSRYMLGRYGDAESLMREAAEISGEALGKEHTDTLKAIETLGRWQKEREERDAREGHESPAWLPFHTRGVPSLAPLDAWNNPRVTWQAQNMSTSSSPIWQDAPVRVHEINDVEEDHEGASQSEESNATMGPNLTWKRAVDTCEDVLGENEKHTTKGTRSIQEYAQEWAPTATETQAHNPEAFAEKTFPARQSSFVIDLGPISRTPSTSKSTSPIAKPKPYYNRHRGRHTEIRYVIRSPTAPQNGLHVAGLLFILSLSIIFAAVVFVLSPRRAG